MIYYLFLAAAGASLGVVSLRIAIEVYLWIFDRCHVCRRPLGGDAVSVVVGDRPNERMVGVHPGCRRAGGGR